jgi:hypothetical protein
MRSPRRSDWRGSGSRQPHPNDFARDHPRRLRRHHRHAAARYTAAADAPAVYAYSDNYLIDLKHAVIMDVEATTAIRQAEVGAAKTMLDRTAEQFEVTPSRLVADAGYGWPR